MTVSDEAFAASVDLLHHILQTIAAQVPSDLVAVYSQFYYDAQVLASVGTANKLSQQALERLVLRQSVIASVDEVQYPLHEGELTGTGYDSALLFPLMLDSSNGTPPEVIGTLGLFAHAEDRYSIRDSADLRVQIGLAQAVMRNLKRADVQQTKAASPVEQELILHAHSTLLNAVQDGVVLVMIDGEDARVLTVNARFAEMFDLADVRPDLEGVSLSTLLKRMALPKPIRQELGEAWYSVSFTKSDTQNGEFILSTPHGTSIYIEWRSAPVHNAGNVLGRIYEFRDVTADRTAQKLRAAFLSRVSHELRTPLTSISGCAQFILQETGEELPDLAREYTEIILSNARHLNNLFTGMIEISRADAGELMLHLIHMHLPDAIIEVVARMEVQWKARNQTVVMEIDDDLPRITFDVDRVAQVLTNLLSNAIKFSPTDSKIRLTTRYIDAQRELPDGAPADVICPCILISVTDEGPGLSKEEVEKVFQPFFRSSYALANIVPGVGLGLAFARSLIELHRGKIWADAANPKKGLNGGRLNFTLPLHLPEA